jgi:hypothetical protein
LERVAQDVEAGGPSWSVLRGHEDDPPGSVPALRLMGAVHRLVLEGHAPALARHYPSVGGDPETPGVWTAFLEVVSEQAERLQLLLERPVQTNEVARSRALLGGFLQIARETNLPLLLSEVGASAGLNLRWDHFRYEVDGHEWGDPGSPLRLRDGFVGRPPSFDVRVDVVERKGCDAAPVDPLTPDGRLTLLSYIWADQVERMARLQAAIQIAGRVPAQVDRADAVTWLDRRLRQEVQGAVRVVYQSIVMQYLTPGDRNQLHEMIQVAGMRATPSSPLAWLRMEPADGHADVRLTVWPDGTERLVAHAGYHGEFVQWLGIQAEGR